MGLANDSMAVVDSRARVFGVSGLRVVDASAFPFLPPGHPQATVCKSSLRLYALSFHLGWQSNMPWAKEYGPCPVASVLIICRCPRGKDRRRHQFRKMMRRRRNQIRNGADIPTLFGFLVAYSKLFGLIEPVNN